MGYDTSIIKELSKFIDTYMQDMIKKYGQGSIACRDKIAHINNTITISEELGNDEFTTLATKFHDIGRFPQYDLLGNFNDRIVNHNLIGENVIEQLIQSQELPNTKELDAIRLVVQYHGREFLIPQFLGISNDALKLINKVTAIDNIENSCIGVLGYIQRERDEDAKGFKKQNPELDMKSVSPIVLQFFLNGYTFDKNTYCKTYADYALFAATLLIKSLRSENHEFCKAIFAKPWFNFSDGMQGYYEIFKDMVDNKYLDICMDTIAKYYNNYIPYEIENENINSFKL